MWRRVLGTVLIGMIVAGVCIVAGLWQLERLDQRRAFNALVSERLTQAPVPAGNLLPVGGELPSSLDWRMVSLQGRYDLSQQILIRGRYFQGRYGYGVLTPLIGNDGTGLLVDRGWVPAGESATVVPDVPAPPAGMVTVVGRLRSADTSLGPQGAVVGLPTRAANSIDPQKIAGELTYPVFAGFVELVDQEPAQELPRPTPAPTLTEGPHLAYAVQWFFFALLGLIAPWVFLRAQSTEPTAG